MTIQEFFKDLWSCNSSINDLLFEIASLEVQKLKISSQFFGPSKASTGVVSSGNYLVDKLVDKQKELAALQTKRDFLKKKKENIIRNILPETEARIIIFKYIDNLTIKDISNILNFSESHIKKKKSAAIKKLEEALTNESKH